MRDADVAKVEELLGVEIFHIRSGSFKHPKPLCLTRSGRQVESDVETTNCDECLKTYGALLIEENEESLRDSDETEEYPGNMRFHV